MGLNDNLFDRGFPLIDCLPFADARLAERVLNKFVVIPSRSTPPQKPMTPQPSRVDFGFDPTDATLYALVRLNHEGVTRLT